MNSRLAVIAAFLLTCIGWCAGLTAARAAKPPVIDGKLDDAAWATAPEYTSFFVHKKGTPAVHPTSVKCLYDDRNLYFGIRCALANGARPRVAEARPRDGGLYQQEGIEVMLDPGRNQDFYYHFTVSSNGDIADEVCEQGGILFVPAWNGQWSAKVAWERDAYTVELAIPLYNFAAARAGVPSGWGINVCRDARPADMDREDSSVANGNYNIGGSFLPLDGVDVDLKAIQFAFHEAASTSVSTAAGRIQTTPSVAFANATGKTFRGSIEAWLCRLSDRKYTFNVKKGFTLANGAAQRFDLNPITHEGEGDYLLCVRAEDENGRTLAYTDRKVSVRLAPLAIDMQVPWYRNAIFATQNITEVRFTVKSSLPPAQARGAQLNAALLDAATGKPVWSASRPAAAAVPFTFPTAGIPDGRYTLKATLAKNGAPLPFGSTSTFLWKLPHRPGEVWMDQYGNWFIDAKPVTINSGWFSRASDYSPRCTAVISHGFAALPPPYQDKLLIDANFLFGPILRTPAKVKLLQQATLPPELLAEVRALVAKASVRKNLFCYYMSDEPSSRSLHPAALRQLYETIRDADPYHPVMISDATKFYDYIDSADLNIHHPYPRIVDDLKYNDCTSIFTHLEGGKRKQAALGHKSSFLFMRMGFNQLDYGYGPANSRIISYEELRDQNIMALAAGIKAMFPYDRSVAGYPEAAIGFPAADQEAAWLLKVVNTPDAPLKLASPSTTLLLRAHEYEGATYIFASNASMDEGQFSFSGLPAGVHSLVVIGEGRTVPVRDGKVVDQFHPCGGHIYTTGTDPGFEPVSSVCRRIEDAWARRRKPGNLFFQRQTDHAVHITVSSDGATYGKNRQTARWHLCDGLETGLWDKGYQWFFWTPAHSSQPAWIEFTPVKPTVIGRVVVFSEDSSLKNYEVQIEENGSWKTVAAVKNAAAPRTEAAFAPRQVTKLRLLIPPWPNPRQPPHLMEVEAYAK